MNRAVPFIAAVLFLGLCCQGARLFTRASVMGYRTATSPVSTYPVTIAAWGRNRSTSGNGVVASICNTSTGHRCQMIWYGATGFRLEFGPGAVGATSLDNTLATNGWYHFAATATLSSTTVTGKHFINGVASTAATTTDSGSQSWNTIAAGERHNGSAWNTWWDGDIEDVCVWSVALDDGEIASLASGVSPALIRPASLRFWMRCGEAVVDRVGGLAITADGTPTMSTAGPKSYSRK